MPFVIKLTVFAALFSPIKSYSFSVAYDEAITSINPYHISGMAAWQTSKLALEFLCNKDPQSKETLPALASSWKISKDHKSITFTLQKGVTWHDGAPFTSDDVVFTLQSLRDPSYGAQAWTPLYSDIESVKAIDQHTVRFQLKQARFSAWEQLAFRMRIFPKHFYLIKNTKLWSQTLVGTGPYVLEKFKKGRFLKFKKNPKWKPRNRSHQKHDLWPNKLAIHFESDPHRVKELIQKGTLDYKALASSEVKKNRQDNRVRQSIFLQRIPLNPGINLSNISIHLKDPVLSQHKIRLALNHLWNRPLIIKKLSLADAQPSASPWSPLTTAHLFEPIAYDPKRALKLLRSEGWQDRNRDGVLENSNGTPLAITLIYDQHHLAPQLALFQQDCKRIGIDLKVKSIASTTTWKLLKQRKFQLYAYENPASEKVLPDNWSTHGEYNSSGFSDSQVDSLFSQLAHEFDLQKRKELQQKIYRSIHRTTPEVYGLQNPSGYALLSKQGKILFNKDPGFFRWL